MLFFFVGFFFYRVLFFVLSAPVYPQGVSVSKGCRGLQAIGSLCCTCSRACLTKNPDYPPYPSALGTEYGSAVQGYVHLRRRIPAGTEYALLYTNSGNKTVSFSAAAVERQTEVHH